jgi:hypothetical protein
MVLIWVNPRKAPVKSGQAGAAVRQGEPDIAAA